MSKFLHDFPLIAAHIIKYQSDWPNIEEYNKLFICQLQPSRNQKSKSVQKVFLQVFLTTLVADFFVCSIIYASKIKMAAEGGGQTGTPKRWKLVKKEPWSGKTWYNCQEKNLSSTREHSWILSLFTLSTRNSSVKWCYKHRFLAA